MPEKTRVILITDGDSVARKAVEEVAEDLHLRCISASAGNPTPISGEEIVHLLKKTPYDPVVIMFDDKGFPEKGDGEMALEYVANHPDIEVLGAVAVASNTFDLCGAKVDVCVEKNGTLTDYPVNKNGDPMLNSLDHSETIVRGDTVDVLNDIDVPVVIGIGDIGKMKRKDDILRGAPITRRAIVEILQRNGIEFNNN